MDKINNKGFTLIELLIVVAIIAILASIAIPQFASYKKKGYIASMNSDAKNAYTAAMAYSATALNVSYQITSADLTLGGFQPTLGVTCTPTLNFIAGTGDVSCTGYAATTPAVMSVTGVLTSATIN